MLQNGILGLAAKDVFITAVGRCRLLVEFFFIERQRFVGDVVVRIRTTAVAALGKYVEHVPVAEADAVFE